ncbi:hypothetical protein [Stenotrophomonas sp. G4]|uniref:hypothetical protein n=1 Tax=Stenotrophomonas sp. G4 TaxID=2303750 RepID=UPI000E3D6BC1|nr:hypothetical protein [Stenotrophomonas sp. G4]
MTAALFILAAAPIRFKSEAGSVGTTLVAPLIITSLLLALAIAALYVARRKGWLQRWSVVPAATDMPMGLRVEQVVRLSPRTRLYRVSDGVAVFTVVESTAHAQIVLGTGRAEPEATDAA